MLPLKVLGEGPPCFFQLLVLPAILGIPWLIDASLQFLPLSSLDPLPVCLLSLCLFSSYKDACHREFKAHSTPVWQSLQRLCFWKKSYSEVWGEYYLTQYNGYFIKLIDWLYQVQFLHQCVYSWWQWNFWWHVGKIIARCPGMVSVLREHTWNSKIKC